MAPRDRDQIVILTSGFNGYYVRVAGAKAPFTPAPVQASRVFLSALGGWLSARGSWKELPSYDTPDSGVFTFDLSEWVHLATEARDHYVKIVDEGFLYPFGHRAARGEGHRAQIRRCRRGRRRLADRVSAPAHVRRRARAHQVIPRRTLPVRWAGDAVAERRQSRPRLRRTSIIR